VVGRALLIACVACAGCTDVFLLPYDGGNIFGSDGGGPHDGGVGLDALDAFIIYDATGGDGGPLILPAACARLGCTPSSMEGDVRLTDGTYSGCHAYGQLTIDPPGITAGTDANGLGFVVCADSVVINGFIAGDGQGASGGAGPGAGAGCGSGGGHGGAGGDPAGCGAGATYGDPNTPRELGSGGGGSGGGDGGGAVEIQAGTINLIGFVTANGAPGTGIIAGGGSGGSVLLHADSILGAGQAQARGGLGTGGGGGGGGRVALYADSGVAIGVSADAQGGKTVTGTGRGTDGSVVHVP
jgi:hypothetical protein